MSDSGLPDETGSNAEETILGVLGAFAVLEIGKLDGSTSVPALLTAIRKFITEIPTTVVGVSVDQYNALATALLAAVEAGEVLPGQVTEATAWVLKVAGGESLNGSVQGNDSLKSAFLHYSVEKGNVVTNPPALSGATITGAHPYVQIPTTAAPAPTRPAVVSDITVPITVPDPTSVGGKMVTAAESTISRVQVAVPGLTAGEARGVSLALGKMYENNLAVLVSVLNNLEGALTDVRTAVNHVADGVANNAESITGLQEFVTHRLDIDEQRIVNLVTASTTEQGYLTSLQGQIDQIDAEIDGIKNGTTPLDLSGIEGQIQGIDAQLPTFAPEQQVQSISGAVTGQGTAIGTIEGIIAASGLAAATMTIPDLVDCCYANDAVTGPITSGGATASLLAGLGGLLGIAGLLATAGGVITAVLGVFDLSDVVAGVNWSAEHVATIVDQAIPAVTADLSWSDDLASQTP